MSQQTGNTGNGHGGKGNGANGGAANGGAANDNGANGSAVNGERVVPKRGPGPAPGAGGMRGPGPMAFMGGRSTEKSLDFKNSALRLLRTMRPERTLMTLGLLVGACSVTLSVLGPKVLGHATDLIFSGFVSAI